MRRLIYVGFVLLMCALLATAPVAAQSEKLVVGSQHSTDAEFDGGVTHQNLRIEDTGSAASLVLSRPAQVDDYEDNDTAEYQDTFGGGINTTSSVTQTGSHAGVANELAGGLSFTGLNKYPQQGDTFSTWYRGNSSGSLFFNYFGSQDKDNSYRVESGPYDDRFNLVKISGGTTTTLKSSTLDLAADTWYRMEIEWGHDGTITVRVYDTNGNLLKEISAKDTEFKQGGWGWQSRLGKTYADNVSIQGAESGEYISANHSVSNAKKGSANLTLKNASADVRWEYHDGSSWVVANSTTYSSSGEHTLDISGVSSSTWRANVTFNNKSGQTTAKLHDEAILFTDHSPNVTNASPTGGEKLQNKSVDLSADINDSEFGTAQGEQLQATWYWDDGTQIDSQTITSNGTYSTTVSGLDGGEHNWYLVVDDSYGLSTRDPGSGYHTFDAPNTLYIYNETSPSNLVKNSTDPINIEVTFYDNSNVITKNTTDGKVNLTGLDPTRQFVVTVDAKGYANRRVVIDSLYQQQSVYLLADSQPSVSPTYVLDDNTGNFAPSETILQVQAPITKDFDGDGDTETRYETIVGDTFGATNEYPTTIRPDVRYRLVVRSGQERRELGTHTVSSSGTVPVPIGEVVFSGSTEADTSSAFSLFEDNGTRYVRFAYLDKQNVTTELAYEIVRSDDPNTTLQPNTTVSGPLGTYRTTIKVPSTAPDDVTYEVRFHATRDGKADVGGSSYAGSVPKIATEFAIDPQVLQLTGYVMIVAVMGFVVIYDDRLAGIAGTTVATALTWIGVVSIPAVGLGVAGATAVLYMAGRERVR